MSEIHNGLAAMKKTLAEHDANSTAKLANDIEAGNRQNHENMKRIGAVVNQSNGNGAQRA